jgi:hypothetical protein
MNPDRDLDLDIAKFNYLWPKAYPYYSKIPLITKFVKKLVADDIIQTGQLFEKALEVECKLVRESTTGRDFENTIINGQIVAGPDAKLVAVRTHGNGLAYSAPVTNIHAKVGELLVAVYERKQGNWYLFCIPHWAYTNIPKTSNIDIPFEFDGTPRRNNRCYINWWNYEVPTFKDLAGLKRG